MGSAIFIKNVYNRGLVIQMPDDEWKADEFLARDAEEVVMHLHDAKSIAEETHLEQCTKPERNIVETRAYWNPLVHRGELLSWNETVVRLVECADNLLERTPWLAALSYSLSLKYKDMQSLSRQYFFRVIQAMLSIHTCYWCAYAARERMEMMWTRSLTKAAPTAT